MSFINILHQGVTKYNKSPTIETVERCGDFVECPECELVLEAGTSGKYLCPFCNKEFLVV